MNTFLAPATANPRSAIQIISISGKSIPHLPCSFSYIIPAARLRLLHPNVFRFLIIEPAATPGIFAYVFLAHISWHRLTFLFAEEDPDSPPPSYSDIGSPASTSAYNATPHPAESDPELSHSPQSSSKAQAHIPRPRNAFIIFRSHYYMRAKATQTGINQNSLSCAAASAWKALSDDEKRPYRRQAEEEKLTHYRKHPNYVYTPINKAVKRAQRKARTVACRRQSAQKIRSSLARRASARSVKTENGQVPSCSLRSPSWHPSPSSDTSDAFSTNFVPLDDIPPLDLTRVRCMPRISRSFC